MASFSLPQLVAQLVRMLVFTAPATRGIVVRPISLLGTTTLLVTPTPQGMSRTRQLRVSHRLRCPLLAHIMIRIVSRMRALQPAHSISTRHTRAVRPVPTWRICLRIIISRIILILARVGGKSAERCMCLFRRFNDIRGWSFFFFCISYLNTVQPLYFCCNFLFGF